MFTRIITTPMADLAEEERHVLCAACAATCDRLAGVRAHRWSLNPATDTVSGTVEWSEYEMIAMGAESLCREVARLHDAHRVLQQCRDPICPASRRLARRDPDTTPNVGFVRHPPDDDPRG